MKRRVLFGFTVLSMGIATALGASPAFASLGSTRASVEIDRGHFSARNTATAGSGFTVDTLTLPNGGVAKEYARADGTVFAVTWQGPSRPDLRQLLGSHFQAFQDDNTSRHRLRSPLNSHRTDLVVHSSGKPGSFWGFAYLPLIIPAGFSATDFK